eukprot:Clim_evm45s218 gene=Clim_evmTU45s218
MTVLTIVNIGPEYHGTLGMAETEKLKESLVTFCRANSIDSEAYWVALHNQTKIRYIRVKEDLRNDINRDVIAAAFEGVDIRAIDWCSGFYSLHPTSDTTEISLASNSLYKEGKVYGLDVSSGYCVRALGVEAGNDVLDICAAPGGKMCFLAELIGSSGSVTAVDISERRANICASLVKKYSLQNVRVVCMDGRKFNWPAPRETVNGIQRLPLKKKALRQIRQRNRRKGLIYSSVRNQGPIEVNTEVTQGCYDRVLVDAECTHDGSLRHILKNINRGTLPGHLDEKGQQWIQSLQADLLRAGWKNLKPGGELVYATCSLSTAQNEEVVEAFLQEKRAEVTVVPLELSGPMAAGGIPGTVRFNPLTHKEVSGLFVTKLKKTKT